MLRITVTPEAQELIRQLDAALAVIRAGIPHRIAQFGEDTVTQIRAQPPFGHPPGGPHPDDHGQLPIFGEHAYIDRTGELTRSIGAEATERQVRIMATSDHADAVEYGVPGRSRPYPFFWPVIWAREPEFEPFVGEVIVRALEEVAEG